MLSMKHIKEFFVSCGDPKPVEVSKLTGALGNAIRVKSDSSIVSFAL